MKKLLNWKSILAGLLMLPTLSFAEIKSWDNGEGEVIKTDQYFIYNKQCAYKVLENIGDINGDGYDDIAGIATYPDGGTAPNPSQLHILKMGPNGLPLGGINILKLAPNNIPAYHLEAFRNDVANEIDRVEDIAEFTDVEYLGSSGNSHKIAVILRRLDGSSSILKNAVIYILDLDNNGIVQDFKKLDFSIIVDGTSMAAGPAVGYKYTSISNIGDVDDDGISDLAILADDGLHFNTAWDTQYPPLYFSNSGSVLICTMQADNSLKKVSIFNAEHRGLVEDIDGYSTWDDYLYTDENDPNHPVLPKIFFSSPFAKKLSHLKVKNLGDLDNSGNHYLYVNGIIFTLGDNEVFQTKNIELYEEINNIMVNNYPYVGEIHILGDLNGDGFTEFASIPRTYNDGQGNFIDDQSARVIYSLVPSGQGDALSVEFIEFYRMTVDNGMINAEMIDNPDLSGFLGVQNSTFGLGTGINIPGSCIIKDNNGRKYVFGSEVNAYNFDGTVMLVSYSVPLDNLIQKQTLSFSDPDSWKIKSGEGIIEWLDGGNPLDKNLKVTTVNGTWLKLISNNPVTEFVGSDVPRIRATCKISFPKNAVNINTYVYRGNIQMLFGGKDAWGRWAGQFEVNGTLQDNGFEDIDISLVEDYNGVSGDDRFIATYRFLLPDNVRNDLVTNNQIYPTISFSMANAGEWIQLDELIFEEDGSEDGRNPFDYINNQNFDLRKIHSWDDYMLFVGGNYPGGSQAYRDECEGNTDLVWNYDGVDVNGRPTMGYFKIKQDVNYPMYLVHWWARLEGYEPGNEYRPWRQCWTYIGAKTIN